MYLKRCRLNWCHLEKPTKNLNNEEIYDAMLIIDKKDTEMVNLFYTEIQNCLKKAEEDGGKKATQGCKIPALKDGDKIEDNKKNAEYLHGKYFITVKNKRQPQLLKAVKKDDKIIKVVAESGDIYNGCYAYVGLNPFFYSNNVNRGITLYLNEIIKVKDGEKLGKPAEDVIIDFDDVGLAEENDVKSGSDWDVL